MDSTIDLLSKGISENWLPPLVIIILIMPFWYLSFYLFHRKFYDNSSNLLKWVFSFCLSFVWFAISSIHALLDMYKDSLHPQPEELGVVPLITNKIADFYFSAASTDFIILILVISLWYLMKRFYSSVEYGLSLYILFGILIGTIIIDGVITHFSK